jgi:hypothetical protein
MNNQTESFEPEVFSLDQIVQSVLDFENLVREKQKSPFYGSSITTAGNAALEMLDTFKRNVPHDTMHDHRIEWRKAVALGDMLRKVLRAKDHPCFEQLWPHILLLLGNANIALNVWNPKDGKEGEDANKIFELYMALVLAPLCPDLELEDLKHSAGGKNPDIIAPLDGTRWAFACKVMHTDSVETFLQNVRKGVDQIQKSNAEKGVVVISLKNQLPHDEFWLSGRPQTSLADFLLPGVVDTAIVAHKLQEFCAGYHHRLIHELMGGPAAFNAIFANTKAVPAVLLHLCTTILVPNEGKPNFRFMRMFCSLNADLLSADLQTTFEKLNLSLHNRDAACAPTRATAATQ